jgi:hypothetical protein
MGEAGPGPSHGGQAEEAITEGGSPPRAGGGEKGRQTKKRFGLAEALGIAHALDLCCGAPSVPEDFAFLVHLPLDGACKGACNQRLLALQDWRRAVRVFAREVPRLRVEFAPGRPRGPRLALVQGDLASGLRARRAGKPTLRMPGAGADPAAAQSVDWSGLVGKLNARLPPGAFIPPGAPRY